MSQAGSFVPICVQLIRTPRDSRRLLESANQGIAPALPEGATYPVQAARRWAEFVLATEHLPDAATPFVAIEKESNACDVVRTLYKTDDFDEIELAQTEFLCSVRVRIKTPVGPNPAETAARVAGQLFGISKPVLLETSGTFFTGVYGKKRGSSGPPTPAPSWFDALSWWQEGNDVGFLMVKYTGTPTKEHLGPEEIYSPDWFQVK